jgi:hypothetical protein
MAKPPPFTIWTAELTEHVEEALIAERRLVADYLARFDEYDLADAIMHKCHHEKPKGELHVIDPS